MITYSLNDGTLLSLFRHFCQMSQQQLSRHLYLYRHFAAYRIFPFELVFRIAVHSS